MLRVITLIVLLRGIIISHLILIVNFPIEVLTAVSSPPIITSVVVFTVQGFAYFSSEKTRGWIECLLNHRIYLFSFSFILAVRR